MEWINTESLKCECVVAFGYGEWRVLMGLRESSICH